MTSSCDGRLFIGCTHLSNWRSNQTTGHSLVIIFTQPFHACNYLSSLWLRLGFPKCKHSMAKLARHVQLHNNVGRKSSMTDKLLLGAYQRRSTWRFQFVDENRARDVALARLHGPSFDPSINYLLWYNKILHNKILLHELIAGIIYKFYKIIHEFIAY